MSESLACPKCGAPLPADAPAGLCPKCLIVAGLQSREGGDHAIEPTSPSPGAARFEPPTIGHLAKLFPQLEILELVGQGGMGAVYKARQPGLDRLVAIKILPPEVGHEPAFAERFAREARALGRLAHPNIVAVHDFGQAGGLFYFLMEYVDGANLRQTIQTGTLDAAEALAIVPQICDALQYAHDEGVVHRDIKPENILLDRRGRVKIADFGLSKLLREDHHDVSLTGTHQVMGTVRYMAPEQMQGTKTVDHRADIYSLGVVFYELLTGDLPMGRFDPPSKKVQLDVRLDEVVLRSLEAEPDRRYQGASELKTDVETIAGSPAVARLANVQQVAQAPLAPRDDDELVRQQIRIPAIGLIVTGILTCFTGLIPLLFMAVSLIAFANTETRPNRKESPPLGALIEIDEPPGEHLVHGPVPPIRGQLARDTALIFPSDGLLAQNYVEPRAEVPVAPWFVVIGCGFVFLIPLGGIVACGGWRMLQLRSYGLAVTAAIVALLPCQPVAILGIIFGIWSLVVLNRSQVRLAFAHPAGESHRSRAHGVPHKGMQAERHIQSSHRGSPGVGCLLAVVALVILSIGAAATICFVAFIWLLRAAPSTYENATPDAPEAKEAWTEELGLPTLPEQPPASVERENLRAVAAAFFSYHSQNRHFPPAASTDQDGQPLLSWRVHLLPCLGKAEGELYDQFHLDEPWNSEHNVTLLGKMPAVYAMPGDTDSTTTRMMVFTGDNAVFGGEKAAAWKGTLPIRRRPPGKSVDQGDAEKASDAGDGSDGEGSTDAATDADGHDHAHDAPRRRKPNRYGPVLAEMLDGTANTILLVAAGPEKAVPWTKPQDIPFNPADPLPALGHIPDEGFLAAFCDGRIQRIEKGISPQGFASLVDPSDDIRRANQRKPADPRGATDGG